MTDPHPLSHRGRKHGKPTSWAVVAMAAIAFATGGVALIFQLWWLFFACAAIFALSVPVGALVGIMDDTVQWTLPPQRGSREPGDPWHVASDVRRSDAAGQDDRTDRDAS